MSLDQLDLARDVLPLCHQSDGQRQAAHSASPCRAFAPTAAGARSNMGNDAWVGITAADGKRHLVVRTDAAPSANAIGAVGDRFMLKPARSTGTP